MFFSTSHELFTFRALKVSQQKACIQVTVQQSGFVSFDLRALEVVILVSGHQGHHGAPGHHQIYGGGLLGLVGLLVGDFYWMITSIPYLLMVTVGIPIISGWWFGMVWKCLEHGFYDFPYIGNFIIPIWRTHIFQRGRSTTNQIWLGFIGNSGEFMVLIYPLVASHRKSPFLIGESSVLSSINEQFSIVLND